MVSPQGWSEPGQRLESEEATLVLRGMLRVEHEGGALDVGSGQAGGAEYLAVCLPAFSPASVHRDE
jgi:hypothetical protein